MLNHSDGCKPPAIIQKKLGFFHRSPCNHFVITRPVQKDEIRKYQVIFRD